MIEDGAAAPRADYAGFWQRLGAYLIDTLLIFVGAVLVGFLIGVVAGEGAAGIAVAYLLIFVGSLLYFVLLDASERQGTIGKGALGLKVTNLEGGRISTGQSLGRNFIKWIFGIGAIAMFFSEKKQALHDMAASTLVVRAR